MAGEGTLKGGDPEMSQDRGSERQRGLREAWDSRCVGGHREELGQWL